VVGARIRSVPTDGRQDSIRLEIGCVTEIAFVLCQLQSVVDQSNSSDFEIEGPEAAMLLP
jgi:hypothetical protein